MIFLKEYNDNIYLRCIQLLQEGINDISTFIIKIKTSKNFKDLDSLITIYNNIFNDNLLKQHIDYNTDRIYKPFFLINPGPYSRANSYWHLALHLKSKEILWLDDLYNSQLSRVLKIYKLAFSKINDFIDIKNKKQFDQFNDFFEEISKETNTFLKSSINKDLIDKKEKLDQIKLSNLPYDGFYHMTHIENLTNILKNGLFSNSLVTKKKLIKRDISNQKIKSKRNRKENVFGRSIQDYVPLYLNPLNPMMESSKVKENFNNIILLEIIPHVLVQKKESLFSDGNASETQTNFYNNQNEMKRIDWKLLREGKWINGSDSQRIMCSEILVPNKIETFYIQKIIIRNQDLVNDILPLFPNHMKIPVEINPDYFNIN